MRIVYKSKDDEIYNSKSSALKADRKFEKERLLERRQSRCKHLFKERCSVAQADIGHHDWVDINWTILKCVKCRRKESYESNNDVSRYHWSQYERVK